MNIDTVTTKTYTKYMHRLAVLIFENQDEAGMTVGAAARTLGITQANVLQLCDDSEHQIWYNPAIGTRDGYANIERRRDYILEIDPLYFRDPDLAQVREKAETGEKGPALLTPEVLRNGWRHRTILYEHESTETFRAYRYGCIPMQSSGDNNIWELVQVLTYSNLRDALADAGVLTVEGRQSIF